MAEIQSITDDINVQLTDCGFDLVAWAPTLHPNGEITVKLLPLPPVKGGYSVYTITSHQGYWYASVLDFEVSYLQEVVANSARPKLTSPPKEYYLDALKWILTARKF